MTGIPGIGKSRNSLELLHTFCTENQGYSAIWLQKISEWSELINADDNLIVLIDDVFGRTNITFDGKEDLKLFDIIYSTIQKGTVKVILTMRTPSNWPYLTSWIVIECLKMSISWILVLIVYK